MQTAVQKAIYPGSFDPFTLGHQDIAERAARLFTSVVVAVVNNPKKQPWLPIETRLQLTRNSLAHLENVTVVDFDGLTVHLAQAHQAGTLIRGLRALSDFEAECMMAQMNQQLAPDIETLFLMASLEHQFLSSSAVKEVACCHGDVSRWVPKPVAAYMKTHSPLRPKPTAL